MGIERTAKCDACTNREIIPETKELPATWSLISLAVDHDAISFVVCGKCKPQATRNFMWGKKDTEVAERIVLDAFAKHGKDRAGWAVDQNIPGRKKP